MTGCSNFTSIETEFDVHRVIAGPTNITDLITVPYYGNGLAVVEDFQDTAGITVHPHIRTRGTFGHVVLPAAFTAVITDGKEVRVVRVAQDQTISKSHTGCSDCLIQINGDLQGCLGAAQEGLLADQALAAPVVRCGNHVVNDQLTVSHTEEIFLSITGLITGITDFPQAGVNRRTVEIVFQFHTGRFHACHGQFIDRQKIRGFTDRDRGFAGDPACQGDGLFRLTFREGNRSRRAHNAAV